MQQRIRRQNLGCFCTAPSIPNMGQNIFSEAVGTFILVFAIKGMANVPGLTDGLGKFLVFGIIVSIGMSLGGLTGYAINPARDIGPRLAHAVLPIKGKGTSNWGYAVVPLVGPVIGQLLQYCYMEQFHGRPYVCHAISNFI